MLGLELHSAELATKIANEMMQNRIILNRTSETVLRFLPPYILQKQARRHRGRQARSPAPAPPGRPRSIRHAETTNETKLDHIDASTTLAGGTTHG